MTDENQTSDSRPMIFKEAPEEETQESQESPKAENKPANSSSNSPLIMMIGFVVIVLLGVVIFQGIFPTKDQESKEDSTAMESLRADIKTRRAEINRQRLALGMEPLAGSSEAESARVVADRLTEDANTLASLVTSFEDLLASKEQQLDLARAESIAALKEQQRLSDAYFDLQKQLRDAMINSSKNSSLVTALDQANQEMETMRMSYSNLQSQIEDLNKEIFELKLENNRLKSESTELAIRVRQTSLFADNEKELMKEAIALFRALRKLQGASPSELSAAYSRFGAELGSTVLTTCEFETGSAAVSPTLEAQLQSIPAETPDNAMIFVVGYASETGNVDSNSELSSDRATAVAEILDLLKKPTQKVQAVYLGQTKRFSSDVPEKNQRVEVWQILPVTGLELPD